MLKVPIAGSFLLTIGSFSATGAKTDRNRQPYSEDRATLLRFSAADHTALHFFTEKLLL